MPTTTGLSEPRVPQLPTWVFAGGPNGCRTVVENKLTISVETNAVEEKVLTLIQLIGGLWLTARTRAKELGEKLIELRELCFSQNNRFNDALNELGIPHSTAYNFIAIAEECRIVDFVFPDAVSNYARVAGMDLTDLGTKTVLYNAFKDAGSPSDPNNGEAIRIVGVAAGAIEDAKDDSSEEEKAATEEPKGKREVMLDSFTTAFVVTYKTFVGTKSEVKKIRPQDVTAREGEFVNAMCEMYHLDRNNSYTREIVLSVGRGKTTLAHEYDAFLKRPIVDVVVMSDGTRFVLPSLGDEDRPVASVDEAVARLRESWTKTY